MKILISGSHGLVGAALTNSLFKQKHKVVRLVRHTPRPGEQEIEWNPERYSIALAPLEGFDAIIHLAGENIAEGRWTEEKKRKIRDSRTKGTRLLSESVARLSHPPSSFICASAIGYYGDRGDEILTESNAPGQGFLSSVCLEWEKATEEATAKGIRVCNLRFGIILDSGGGALAKMLTPFRMGVGGNIGNGRQWMSWIALDDVVAIVTFAVSTETLSGPINAVAPNPVTNAEFTKVLGRVLLRPTLFPVPAFAVRFAFGEMADALLLSSQRVEPRLLQKTGYTFHFPLLEPALRHILLSERSGQQPDRREGAPK